MPVETVSGARSELGVRASEPSDSWTPRAQLALLARILHREGFNDHTAGHITLRLDDDTLLLNPWEKTWARLCASDIIQIDLQGNLLEGNFTVTPGVELHLAMHRVRPDAKVLVHNHPEWSLVWAAVGELPPIYDQTGALVHNERIAFYDQYQGTVADPDVAALNVAGADNVDALILANHGVLVVGDTVQRAYVRSMSLEWRCKLGWRVAATGRAGRPISDEVAAALAEECNARQDAGWPHLWTAMATEEIDRDPTVLD